MSKLLILGILLFSSITVAQPQSTTKNLTHILDFLNDGRGGRISTVDQFCSKISVLCKSTTGSENCFNGKTKEVSRESRWAAFFRSFPLLKDKAKERCCSRADFNCRNTFDTLKTAFPIAGDQDRAAYYDYSNNTLYFKSTFFNRWPLKANVDRVISHELGHVCQSALANYPFKCDKNKSEALWTQTLGSEVFQCVDELVSSMPEIPGPFGFCLNKRYDEAFADVVFSDFTLEPVSYAYDCFNYPDSTHPTNRAYMHCMQPFRSLKLHPSLDWGNLRAPYIYQKVPNRIDR